ncbi:MAG: amidohydrolase family protein, partial [Spirochaetes bacterium]|nr:amidohydrolase family protein [Spirochaetota bacterium]
MKAYDRMLYTRRKLLKDAALFATALAIPEFSSGCASLRPIERFAINYENDIILNNCNIVDPHSDRIRANASIRISNGKIIRIENKIEGTGINVPVFELNGAYVIPGLINAHCHATMTGAVSFNPGNFLAYMRQITRNFELCIRSGETTIRDMGALPNVLHDHIEKINRGELIGPRVIYCNSIMNIDGGHPDIKPSDISVFGNVTTIFTGNITANFRTIDELREKLRENADSGARFIKLTVDNRSLICGRGEIPMYSREHLREIFNFAQRHNLPVSCHNHMRYGFDRIIEYPIHSLEHLVFDDYLTDEDIEKLRQRNVSIVPTFIVAQCLAFNEVFDEIPDEYNTEFIRNEMRIKYEYLRTIAGQYCEEEIHADNMQRIRFFRRMNCRDLLQRKIFLPNPVLYFGMMKYGLANLLRMKQAGITIGCGTDAGVPYDYFGTLWREMEMLHRAGSVSYTHL